MVIILNYLNVDGVQGSKNIAISKGFEKQFLPAHVRIIDNVKNSNINNPPKDTKYSILKCPAKKAHKMEKIDKSNKLLSYIQNCEAKMDMES